MKSVELICSGLVQGVNFRSSTQQKALQLNISGWVMNLASGEVKIIAQGQNDAILMLIEWCLEGPFLAKVDEVVVKNIEESTNLPIKFEIRY